MDVKQIIVDAIKHMEKIKEMSPINVYSRLTVNMKYNQTIDKFELSIGNVDGEFCIDVDPDEASATLCSVTIELANYKQNKD